MAYGRAQGVTDPAAKLRAMEAFIDRFYPSRTSALRPFTAQEIKAITILQMRIEDAAAKIRATGVVDEEADYAVPVFSAVPPTAHADRRAAGVSAPIARRDACGGWPGRLRLGAPAR